MTAHAPERSVPLARRQLGAERAKLVLAVIGVAWLDTPLVFPAPAGGLLNLDNWRRRAWAPAVEASGIAPPRRSTTLRSTFATDAPATGVSVFSSPGSWARASA